MTKKEKRESVAQLRQRKRVGQTRSTIVFPKDVYRRLAKAARTERRGISPMTVVLVERALQSMEALATS